MTEPEIKARAISDFEESRAQLQKALQKAEFDDGGTAAELRAKIDAALALFNGMDLRVHVTIHVASLHLVEGPSTTFPCAKTATICTSHWTYGPRAYSVIFSRPMTPEELQAQDDRGRE